MCRLNHYVCCSILYALLITISAAEPIGSYIVQPTTYESPNGDYSLFVDPTDKHGMGDAVYRFEHKGQQVWSRNKQFTLQGVEVTDRGFVMGAAHDGYCHLVILDAAGGIKLDEWFVQHRRGTHSDKEPYVEQILVSEEHDFVTFRLYGHDRCNGKPIGSLAPGEVWSAYRISTGELLHEFKAIEQYTKLGSRWYIIDAHVVRGTPLILVHWHYSRYNGKKEVRKSQYSIVDLAGLPIWSLEMDNDYTHRVKPQYYPQTKPDSFYSNDPAILATHESNQFRIRRFADDIVLTFSVKKKADGKWSIREESQAAYEPEDASTHKVKYDGELKYLGELELGQTKNDDSPTGQDSDFAGFTVDRLGRYYVASKSTGITTVFNKDGTIEHRLVPEAADYSLPLHRMDIHIASDESVYVNDWRSNRYIRFKPDGARDKKITFEPRFVYYWIFLSQSGDRLGVNLDRDLVIVDDNGHIKRTMKKRPNGKWFYNTQIAASPDGEIASLSRDVTDGTTSYTLDRFNANGDHIDTIVIPPSTSGYNIVHTGPKILLVGRFDVVIVTLKDHSMTRWRINELSLDGSRGIGFVDDQAGQLLLYYDISRSVHRYQLPTN